MDYKAFLDNFTRVACVLSVDLKAADSKDRYFVVDANDAYKLTVVKKLEDFECNVPYTRYIQQADNFEALCDECVTKDRPVHTYFDIELYNAWMEVFFTPLASSDPDKKKASARVEETRPTLLNALVSFAVARVIRRGAWKEAAATKRRLRRPLVAESSPARRRRAGDSIRAPLSPLRAPRRPLGESNVRSLCRASSTL